MKRILTIALSAFSFFIASSQDNIQFNVGRVSASSEISDEATKVLESKLSQILNRNSAAAGGNMGVFEVVSALDVEGSQSTSGLVQNVVQVQGSVVLTAKNVWDNAEYYSVTVPLTAVSKGNVEDPALLLARSIKITEPAYVRFIKKARENISRSLEQDCAVTVERAQAFITAGYYNYALNMLLALPPGNSCNDLSQELIGSIRAYADKQIQKEEEKEKDLRADKMKLAEMVLTGKSPSESSEDNTSGNESNDMSGVEVYSSNPAWKLSVTSCKWISENRMVSVGLKVETTSDSSTSYFYQVDNVITENGDSYGWSKIEKSTSNLSVPSRVPVNCRFDVKCNENPKKLSFVKLMIGSTTFEIRNLPVE